MSVTITGFSVQENKEGKSFVCLELQGEVVMKQSQLTGRFYASAQRATITSTFTEAQAQMLIGKQIPGRIEKVACPEYEFTNPDTGELMVLSHRYEYLPEEKTAPMRVVSGVAA